MPRRLTARPTARPSIGGERLPPGAPSVYAVDVPGDGFRVCFADETLVMATQGKLVVYVFRGTLTMEHMRHMRRENMTLQALLGAERINITVVEPAAVTAMPEDVRHESAAQLRSFPAALTAVVLEGSGFRMATARAIFSGLTLLAGERNTRRTFDSVEQATQWMIERAPGAASELSPAAVTALVQRTRAAFTAR